MDKTQQRQAAAPPAGQDDLVKEVQGLKEMMIKYMAGDKPQQVFPPAVARRVERLKDQDVDEDVIRYLLDRLVKANPRLEVVSEQDVQQQMFGFIRGLFEEAGSMEQTGSNQVRLISFFGPTGVGKTTTIAKLAAEQVLQHNRRVGMITTDTYRIAAVEQLRTYANILNVPIETVFSPDGLKKAVKNLQDCDVIFMDTTGRNFCEELPVQELGKYVSQKVVQENYLVVSLTAKYRDVKKMVDNFKSIAIDKLILTKLDETTSYGTALNLAYHYPYPLAYITNGQSVPEDILKAEPEDLTTRIMGEGLL